MESTDYLHNQIQVHSRKLLLHIFVDVFRNSQGPTCNGILMLNVLFALVPVLSDLAPK